MLETLLIIALIYLIIADLIGRRLVQVVNAARARWATQPGFDDPGFNHFLPNIIRDALLWLPRLVWYACRSAWRGVLEYVRELL